METVLQTIGGIILALLALMFMVVVHEAGHYTVGKLFKFKINEFSIGFGKAIFKRKMKSGEDFSIRLIPFGGYCAFEGEDEDNSDPRAFNNQKPWKRLLVLASGAIFNLISAILIISLTFTFYGDILPCASVNSAYVQENSAFKEGDIILSIDDTNFSFFSSDFSHTFADGEHVAVVRRLGENGKRYEEKVTFTGEDYSFIEKSSLELYAYYLNKEGIVAKGFEDYEFGEEFSKVSDAELKQNYDAVSELIQKGNCVQYRFYRVRFGFFSAVGRGFVSAFRMVGLIFTTFIGLFTGGTPVSDLGGPITIISMLGESAVINPASLMYFVCLISANLAVFNLLPIPSLDGSRMLFVAIEWVRGKPISRNVEGIVHFVGLIFIFGFAIMVDVLRLFR